VVLLIALLGCHKFIKYLSESEKNGYVISKHSNLLINLNNYSKHHQCYMINYIYFTCFHMCRKTCGYQVLFNNKKRKI